MTGPAGTLRGGSVVNHLNHSIMLGVRYAFNAAPPPPPFVAPAPAAAAAPARTEVGGRAGRSGTRQYNERLSRRRAEALAAELERQGVARGLISVQAFGESRPLVAAADGVREPQNPRVEIVLRGPAPAGKRAARPNGRAAVALRTEPVGR